MYTVSFTLLFLSFRYNYYQCLGKKSKGTLRIIKIMRTELIYIPCIAVGGLAPSPLQTYYPKGLTLNQHTFQ